MRELDRQELKSFANTGVNRGSWRSVVTPPSARNRRTSAFTEYSLSSDASDGTHEPTSESESSPTPCRGPQG